MKHNLTNRHTNEISSKNLISSCRRNSTLKCNTTTTYRKHLPNSLIKMNFQRSWRVKPTARIFNIVQIRSVVSRISMSYFALFSNSTNALNNCQCCKLRCRNHWCHLNQPNQSGTSKENNQNSSDLNTQSNSQKPLFNQWLALAKIISKVVIAQTIIMTH